MTAALTPSEVGSVLINLRADLIDGKTASIYQLDALDAAVKLLDLVSTKPAREEPGYVSSALATPAGAVTHWIASLSSDRTACCSLVIDDLPMHDKIARRVKAVTCPIQPAHRMDPAHAGYKPGVHRLVPATSTGDPMCACGWNPEPTDQVRTAIEASLVVSKHVRFETARAS